MVTRQAPLTRAKTGSTICPGCSKRFANTPGQTTVDIAGTEENRGRIDSVGQMHRGIGRHDVTRRWHADCLHEQQERDEAYRAQCDADREATARSIAEAAGIDYDEWKARRAERDED